MDACSPNPSATALATSLGDDRVSLRRWFVPYIAGLAAACALLALLAAGGNQGFSTWVEHPVRAFTDSSPVLRLLGFTIYLSLCCTFLPLPTGWAVAAVATRQAAVAGDLATITLLVAFSGAVGSTLANLNDYHLFTWMLRHHRIAAVRRTKTYGRAAAWFARSPFFLLVVFNVIPIPVDVVRMLATTYRYPRVPFGAASFVGRFLRYGVIAFVTFWWDLGWIAPVALLALAVVLGLLRLRAGLFKRPAAGGANEAQAQLSDIEEPVKEQTE